MSVPSVVLCPHCQGQIAANPKFAGKRVACPHCKQPLLMPGQPVVAEAIPIEDEPAPVQSEPLDFLQSSGPSTVPSHSPVRSLAHKAKKSGIPVGVWVGAGVLGFLLLVMCAGIASHSGSGGGGDGGGGGGVMTREKFRQAVIGKTQEQVIKAVGKPDQTMDYNMGSVWYYMDKVTDTVTGNEGTATIDYQGGVAQSVGFN